MDPLFLFVAELFLLPPPAIYRKTSPFEPTEWPIVGHLLSLAANIHNFHDCATSILTGSGYSFAAHGGRLTGLRFFVTRDPANACATSSRPSSPTTPRQGGQEPTPGGS
ncbi:hypothetical protein C2845_PM15G09080 [Panicum miliaceum]|uniref:Uncharacterized protein n=1 Tax=Panicum miliaceum TaxID=4540 RepID=A0A3L6Q788_PANMI|nr:hypothetical protein C2845_PM15G09080 [Panicum miliaceum]